MVPFDGERLQRAMRARGADVVLASARHNVRYLTGGYYLPFFARTSRFGRGQYLSFVGIPASRLDSAFYVGRQDEAMDEEDYIRTFGSMWITNRRWIPRGGNMSVTAAEGAAQMLRDQGLAGRTIAVELPFLPADAFEALRRSLPEASFVDATPILAALRAVKRPTELERLERVHQATAEAVRAAMLGARPEYTTRQIAAMVQRGIEERGGSFLYVFTNVGPGFLRAPSSMPWGRGHAMHVDAGAEVDEYVSDIARMGSVGAPSALAMELFQGCLEGQAAARNAAAAGLPCRDLWRIGTEALSRGPYGRYGRFLAHGLGMVSHEPPEVGEKSDATLEASMVISIETEFRHPDAGHIKIEDTVVVTPTGSEGLGDVAREWCVVPDA